LVGNFVNIESFDTNRNFVYLEVMTHRNSYSVPKTRQISQSIGEEDPWSKNFPEILENYSTLPPMTENYFSRELFAITVEGGPRK
jgi:hypothetical protein